MADHGHANRVSVHQALGGGSAADVLLWKTPGASILLLVSSTSLWFLFERAGYNILSFVSNVLLLLVSILFFWAKSASLLNRPLPPIPSMEISETYAISAADEVRVWINSALSIACDITIGRNLKRLLQVTFVFWMMSFVGSFLNFLTVIYIGVLLSLSVPVLYVRYQPHIDDKLCMTYRIIRTLYRRLDEVLLSKLQRTINKEKKTQ